jgi:hypothetical protein
VSLDLRELSSAQRSQRQAEERLTLQAQPHPEPIKSTPQPVANADVRAETKKSSGGRVRIGKDPHRTSAQRGRQRKLPASLMPQVVDVRDAKKLGAREDGVVLSGEVIAS